MIGSVALFVLLKCIFLLHYSSLLFIVILLESSRVKGRWSEFRSSHNFTFGVIIVFLVIVTSMTLDFCFLLYGLVVDLRSKTVCYVLVQYSPSSVCSFVTRQ